MKQWLCVRGGESLGQEISVAFHGLLTWLCRCKHVESAEALFVSRRREFGYGCMCDRTMKRSGLGPDQRTYTIRIHGLHTKGKIGEALSYYQEMVSRGMVPEPRTEILLNKNKFKPKDEDIKLRVRCTGEETEIEMNCT
ncbi:unnamed protein product [Cochlearia groenlandica]